MDTSNSKAYISSFCKARLHIQYALKEKAACFTATLVSTCQTAKYHNLKHCNIDHIGSVTMQSLCTSNISNTDGKLHTPCFPLLSLFFIFLQPNCHDHHFYMCTVWEWRHHRYSNYSNGYGFSVVTMELVSAWRHRVCFCRKGKQMTVWADITSPDSNRFGLRVKYRLDCLASVHLFWWSNTWMLRRHVTWRERV